MRDKRIQTSNNGRNRSDLELFGSLPRDIAINVLSRLGVESIMECKVVCKEWRDLIKSPEFASSQRYRRLIVFPRIQVFPSPEHRRRIFPDEPYKIKESDSNRPLPIVYMGLDDSVPLVRSSVNGLILLLRRQWTEQLQQQHLLLWVCNPITREYVRIPNPDEREFELGLPYPPVYRSNIFNSAGPTCLVQPYGNYNFGFGVSRTSLQFKVVWISQSQCRVYTLGTTGQWRSIGISGAGGLRYHKWNTECAFVDGNLYWLDPPESETQTEISCFDLETEVFAYFSAPPTREDIQSECYRSLCVFDECLCLCDVYDSKGIEIWLKGRGQGDWSKKLAINEQQGPNKGIYECGCLFPIKELEEEEGGNGVLLGFRSREFIYCYSNDNGGGGTRTLAPFNPSPDGFEILRLEYPNAAIFTSSFLPLRTLFADEDVGSF